MTPYQVIVGDIRSSVLASEGIPQVNWVILTGGEKTGRHVQGGGGGGGGKRRRRKRGKDEGDSRRGEENGEM